MVEVTVVPQEPPDISRTKSNKSFTNLAKRLMSSSKAASHMRPLNMAFAIFEVFRGLVVSGVLLSALVSVLSDSLSCDMNISFVILQHHAGAAATKDWMRDRASLLGTARSLYAERASEMRETALPPSGARTIPGCGWGCPPSRLRALLLAFVLH